MSIGALWLAIRPMAMRAGTEGLLASVVQMFGQAQAHHGYLSTIVSRTRPSLGPRGGAIGSSYSVNNLRLQIKPQCVRACVRACKTDRSASTEHLKIV